MAGPSEGMFSSPIAFGRYRARRSGPRNTYFMANQNITASPPAVRLPGRGLDTVVLDYTGSSDLENVQADGGFRRARVVLPGSPRPVGRRGDGVPAVPAGPAVPNPLPTVSPIRSPRSGPRPAVVHGCEPFRSEGGPVGVWLQHGFTGCPASMRPFGMWLAERGLTVVVPRLPGHGTSPEDLAATSWEDWDGEAGQAVDELAARCSTVIAVGLSFGATLALHQAATRPDAI